MSDDLNIPIRAGDAVAATAALHRLADALEKTGDAGKRAGDGAKKADSSFKEFKESVVGIADHLTNLASKAVALGRSFVDSAVAADQQARALQMLGGAYLEVERATNGTVTAQEALRAQQGLVQSGLNVTSDQLAAITRRARDYALATGTETSAALDQLVDALRGGEAEGFRRFGITLQNGTDRTHAFQQALSQWTREQGRAGVAARTAAEEVGSLGASFSSAMGSMARGISQLEPVKAMLQELATFLRDIRTHFDDNEIRGRFAAQAAESDRVMRLRGQARRVANDHNLQLAPEEITLIRQGNAADLERFVHDVARGSRATFSQVRSVRTNEAADRAVAEEQERALDAAYANPANTNAPARGGGDNGIRDLRRELAGARAASIAMGAGEVETGHVPGESQAQYLRAQIAAYRELTDAQREHYAEQRTLEQATRERREQLDTQMAQSIETQRQAENSRWQSVIDNIQSVQDRLNETMLTLRRRNDFGTQMRSQFHSAQTAAESMAQGVKGAFDLSTSAMTTHLIALAQGKETVGQAFLGMAADVSVGLVQQALPKFLMAMGDGFALQAATFGAPNPASIQAFTAAGFYGALTAAGIAGTVATSAIAGSAGGSGGGSTAPANDNGARTGREGRFGGGGMAGGEGSTVVNYVYVNGALNTREDIQDAVVSAGDRAGRRGYLSEAARAEARRRAA